MQIIPLNLDSVLLFLHNSKLAYFYVRHSPSFTESMRTNAKQNGSVTGTLHSGSRREYVLLLLRNNEIFMHKVY